MKTIEDIMCAGADNAVVTTSSCFRDVLREMDTKKLGAVCITADKKLVGIITDGDIRRLLLITQDSLPELFMKQADAFMNINPIRIDQTAALEECLTLPKKHRFWVMPVVNQADQLVGMIQMHNLLAALDALR